MIRYSTFRPNTGRNRDSNNFDIGDQETRTPFRSTSPEGHPLIFFLPSAFCLLPAASCLLVQSSQL
jgi:hypothetical protein